MIPEQAWQTSLATLMVEDDSNGVVVAHSDFASRLIRRHAHEVSGTADAGCAVDAHGTTDDRPVSNSNRINPEGI